MKRFKDALTHEFTQEKALRYTKLQSFDTSFVAQAWETTQTSSRLWVLITHGRTMHIQWSLYCWALFVKQSCERLWCLKSGHNIALLTERLIFWFGPQSAPWSHRCTLVLLLQMTPNVQNFKTLQTFTRIGEPKVDLLLQGKRFGQRFCACTPLWPAHIVK